MKKESLFKGTSDDQDIQEESFQRAREAAQEIVRGNSDATIRVSRKDRAKKPGNDEVYEERS